MPFKPNEYYSEQRLWGILLFFAKPSLKTSLSDGVFNILFLIIITFIVKIVGLHDSDSTGE